MPSALQSDLSSPAGNEPHATEVRSQSALPRLPSVPPALAEHSEARLFRFHYGTGGQPVSPPHALTTLLAYAQEPAETPRAFEQVVGSYIHALIEARQSARQRTLAADRDLYARLAGLLEADRRHAGEPAAPSALGQSLGAYAGDCIDLERLSRSLPDERGPRRLGEERRTHIEALCGLLGPSHEPEPMVQVFCARALRLPFASDSVPLWVGGTPLTAAEIWFSQIEQGALRRARARRAAELELLGAYQAELHDAVLEGLELSALSDDERLSVPVALVVERGDTLKQARALLAEEPKPLHVLAERCPWHEQTLLAAATETPFSGWVSGWGERFVVLGSVDEPAALDRQLARMARQTAPALALLATSDIPTPLEAKPPRLDLLRLSRLARLHPQFVFDPGEPEARSRAALSDSEAPNQPWLSFDVPCVDSTGRVEPVRCALTPADVAAQVPPLQKHLLPLQVKEWARDQLPLSEYVARARGGTLGGQLPFVWCVNREGYVVRALVSRVLARATLARARAFSGLKALCGLGDPWAEAAREAALEEAQHEADAAREELLRQHSAALQAARSEAASQALRRLVDALLTLDLSEEPRSARPACAAGETADQPPAEPEREEPVEPPIRGCESDAATTDSPVRDEAAAPVDGPLNGAPPSIAVNDVDPPFVDTPRCTSCNECTQKFPTLFAYDENKQALFVGDDDALFAALVAAAEKCPAHCIYPGSPRPDDASVSPEVLARAQALP